MSRISRRRFLATASAAAGASLLITGTRAAGNFQGANDRLRIAVAGLNGRGKSHIDGWLDQENVEIAYLVDPDQTVLDRTLKGRGRRRWTASTRRKASATFAACWTTTRWMRFPIATPNHWHSLMTIWAAQAGKHVYVEKPMSHDVAEGRVAMMAQKKYGVVVQHGTQSRSSAEIAGLHEAIQAGKFGKLKIAYGYCCKERDSIGRKSPSPRRRTWIGTCGAARPRSTSITATSSITTGTGSGRPATAT